MDQLTQPKNELALFSRRTVFKLGSIVGSSFFLGSALGGKVMAFADEEGTPYFEIVFVAPDEVAIAACDVSQTDPAGNPEALSGVSFSLVSLSCEDADPVTGVTNEQGIALVNIRRCCPNRDEVDASDFSFYGEISATKDGYRDYATGMVFVLGGLSAAGKASVTIPTQPFSVATDKAYLRKACFDRNDIQYSSAEVEMTYEFRNNDKSFEFEVVCDKGTYVECTLYGNLSGAQFEIGKAGVTANDNGLATITITDKWGSKLQDKPGATISAHFAVGSATAFDCNFNATFVESPVSDEVYTVPYQRTDAQYSLGGFVDVMPASSKAKPKEQKGGAGSLEHFFTNLNFSVLKPILPIQVTVKSWNTVMISGSLNIISYEKNYFKNPDTGKVEPGKWSNKSILNKEAREKYATKISDGLDKLYGKDFPESVKVAEEPENPIVRPDDDEEEEANLIPKCELAFSFNLGLLLILKLQKDQPTYVGTGAISASTSLGVTVSASFALGPVPCHAGISLSADAMASFGYERLSIRPLDKTCTETVPSFGTYFDGSVTVAVNFGVGTEGLLALGVKFYAKFGTIIDYAVSQSADLDTKYPHYTVDWSAGGKVYFQFLFFKTDWTVWETKNINIYDSWKSASALPEGGASCDDALYLVTTDDDLRPSDTSARAKATLQANGALQYDTSGLFTGVWASDYNGVADDPGVVDPYDSNDPYDIRKGARATLVSTVQSDTFSDPRVKFVTTRHTDAQTNETVKTRYMASIVKTEVSLEENSGYQLIRVPLEGCDGGNIYVVPDATINAAKSYLSKDSTEQKTCDLSTLISPSQTLCASKAVGVGDNFENLALGKNPFKNPVSADGNGLPIATIAIPVYQDEVDAATDEDGIKKYQARAASLWKAVTGESDIAEVAEYISKGYLENTPQNITYTRTRVQISELDGDDPAAPPVSTRILDFQIPAGSTKLNRTSLNDVDFEMTADGDKILVGIVSAHRNPRKTDLDFDDAVSRTFSSCLVYAPHEQDESKQISCVYCNAHDYEGTDGDYEWRALPVKVPSRSGEAVALVAAGQLEGVFALAVHCFPADASAYYNGTANTYKLVPSGENKISNSGTYWASVNPDVKLGSAEILTIAWQYGDKAHRTPADGQSEYDETYGMSAMKERVAVWGFNMSSTAMKDKDRIAPNSPYAIEKAQSVTMFGGNKGMGYLVPQGDGTTGAFDLIRRNFAYDASGNPVLAEETLGVTTSSEFASIEDGDYLFVNRITDGEAAALTQDEIDLLTDDTVQVQENESPFAPAAGTFANRVKSGAGNATKVVQTQTLCCRWDPVYKRYRQFFAYRQADYNAMQMSVYKSTKGTVFLDTLMPASNANINSQESEVKLTVVPDLLSVRAEETYCSDGFIRKGESDVVHPVVKVLNAGHLPVRGFTLNFKSKSSGAPTVPSVTIDQLEKYVLKSDGARDPYESVARRASEDLKARVATVMAATDATGDAGWAEDEDAILWPGCWRYYQVPVAVPASSTSGIFDVYVTATDPIEPIFDSQTFLLGNESFERAYMLSAAPSLPLDLCEVREESAVAPGTVAANYYSYANQPGGSSGGNSGNGSGNGSSSGSNSSSAAKTGDNALGLAAALLAVAAAAAVGTAAAKEGEKDETSGEDA